MVPIVEVQYGVFWRSLPLEISRQLYERKQQGEDAGYSWDWGEEGRAGTWEPEGPGGPETIINRYMIEWVQILQRNIDTERRRSVRIVFMERAACGACE